MTPNFTPAQVQKMLGLPPSTLRHYSRLFADYLSTPAKSGRKRHYSARDVTILGDIMHLSGEGVRLADIPARLGEMVDLIETDDVPQQQVNALALPQILQRIEKTDDRLDRLEQQQAAQLARLQALEAWYKLPWWKRLGKKPPE